MGYYSYNDGKLVGKIYSFDGEIGTVITPQGEYQFTYNDLYNKELDIKKGTMVEFYSNTIPFGDDKYLMAKEVNVIKLEKGIDLKRGRF